MQQLKFKNAVNNAEHKTSLYRTIKNVDLIILLKAIYGGYENIKSFELIAEYFELVSFLDLSPKQKEPFLYYYDEIYGQDDPVSQMVIRADQIESAWQNVPSFTSEEFYSESLLTAKILDVLEETVKLESLRDDLKKQITSYKMVSSDRAEFLLAIAALEAVDSVKLVLDNLDTKSVEYFKVRLDQLLYNLSDIVVRLSPLLVDYLTFAFKNNAKANNFAYYCKVLLGFTADIGGIPMDTRQLVARFKSAKISLTRGDEEFLCAEYLAFLFTGADNDFNMKEYYIFPDDNLDLIVRAYLRIHTVHQLYKPIRKYIWQTDCFVFKHCDGDEIPVSFLNHLDTIHNSISNRVKSRLFTQFCKTSRNTALFTLFALNAVASIGEYSDELKQHAFEFIPELASEDKHKNIKKTLLKRIDASADSESSLGNALCII